MDHFMDDCKRIFLMDNFGMDEWVLNGWTDEMSTRFNTNTKFVNKF